MSLDQLELISLPLLRPLLLTPLQSRPLHTVSVIIFLLFLVFHFFFILALSSPLHQVVRPASVGEDLSRAILGLVVEAVGTISERKVVVFLLDGRLRVEGVLVIHGQGVWMEAFLEHWVRKKGLRCTICVRECCPCILA